MKKFVLFLMVALLVVVLPASAAKQSFPSGMTMQVPSDWTSDPNGAQASKVAILLVNSTGAAITVTLSRSGDMTLEKYKDSQMLALKKDQALKLKLLQAVTIAKTKWYKMIFEFTRAQDNVKMGAAQFFTFKNHIQYQITYAAPLSLYSQCYGSAERMIYTFTFPTQKI
ncbi:MAG: hypothetical protein V2A78_07635 [bacterium]